MIRTLNSVYAVVWGAPTMLFILGSGIWFTIRTEFVQVRLFPKSFHLLADRSSSKVQTVSPFRALCIALAATVGTGNLIGVASAVCLGGPGAVLWMLVCGFFGIAIKYAEAVLAVHYRTSIHGEIVGGPMYMIQLGLHRRWHPLALCYSILGLVASFGVGNLVQSNAIAACASSMFRCIHLPPLFWGIVLMLLVGTIFRSGAHSIGKIAEHLVPLAVGMYIILCLCILLRNAYRIPIVLYQIWTGAFTPKAVTGGLVGSLLKTTQIGCSRGIFSNEAGMGTASIAHASAEVIHPVQQGILGMLEVFLDTFVICTLTALAVLCTGIPIPYGQDAGLMLITKAFSVSFPHMGALFISLFIMFFAYATILGWSYYGLRCYQFLFETKAVPVFFLLQTAAVVVGAVLKTPAVWRFAEVINGLMTIPNLIALLLLTPELIRLTKDYTSDTSCVTGGNYANIHQC